jgi:hypothetical protein
MSSIRKLIVVLSLLCAAALSLPALAQEGELRPFVLASSEAGDFEAKVEATKSALTGAGFRVLGEYRPYDGAYVVAVTSDALIAAAKQTPRGGYGAVQRVAVNQAGIEVQVSYANPLYTQHAYQMETNLSAVDQALAGALGKVTTFGAEGEKMTPRKLERYHYTFGMEYYEDPYELARYGSYAEAVAAVEKGLSEGAHGITQVYRLDLPGTQTTVFGVAMQVPEGGAKHMDDAFQMGVVDQGEYKSSAYLPYEVLVRWRDIEALHMRFRMAVHFPQMKMMGSNSFMTLMPSPDAIHKALARTVGGEYSDF